MKKKKERLGRMFGLIVCMSLFMTTGSMGEVQASGTDPAVQASRVFQVIFPGDTEHIFDFIMDPQKLISQTDAAAYGDSVFEEDATLFFRRMDGRAAEDYSSSSDALVITNVGTEDVDIVLTASITWDSAEGIHMADDPGFPEDMDASLYLALTDGEQTEAIVGEEGASIHTTLKGVSEENGAHQEYRFWLTGAVNENGDWSQAEGAVPKVTVTWDVTSCKAEGTKAEDLLENSSEELPAGKEAAQEETKPEDGLETPKPSKESTDQEDLKPSGTEEEAQGGGTDATEDKPADENEVLSEDGTPAERSDPEEKEPFGEEADQGEGSSGENADPAGQEPSGEGEDPAGQEPSGENEDPAGQEPSGESEDPAGQEPSGENEDTGEKESPEENTDARENEFSEENADAGEKAFSEENIDSKGREFSGENTDARENELFEENINSVEKELSEENTDSVEKELSEETQI